MKVIVTKVQLENDKQWYNVKFYDNDGEVWDDGVDVISNDNNIIKYCKENFIIKKEDKLIVNL